MNSNYSDVNESLNSDELTEEILAKINKLKAYEDKEKEAVLINEVVREYVEEWSNEPTGIRGLSTGYTRLDESINGLMPGALTVIAGIAGAGKSTVLLNVAEHVAFNIEEPVPVYFISTEMYTKEDTSRLLAMRSMIREREIFNGIAYNDPKQRQILDGIINDIENGQKFFHEYMPDFSASKLCSKIHYHKAKHNIGLVIFDYIKLDTSLDENKLKNRREDQILGDLANALKLTAGKLGIPVLAACQINTRTLRVADSDRIERYCNNLIEFREKTVEELQKAGDHRRYGTHWFTIRKARPGGRIKAPVRFWKRCNLIQDAETFEEEKEEDAVENPISVESSTPEEYERLINESFKVEGVQQIVQHTDMEDIEAVDGTINVDDDPLF
ncbi:hypothetical protein DRO38_06860 [Candidatus Bathyarchaeota archaeon]|nr:MAG: hypothetical protein DRO38_06860 [Candidatus Bathyarchaeota archaeon]